jgi:hypothetical protein
MVSENVIWIAAVCGLLSVLGLVLWRVTSSGAAAIAFSSASYAIYLLVLGIVLCVLLLGRRRVGDPVGAE